jgi:hypothetical protein
MDLLPVPGLLRSLPLSDLSMLDIAIIWLVTMHICCVTKSLTLQLLKFLLVVIQPDCNSVSKDSCNLFERDIRRLSLLAPVLISSRERYTSGNQK